MTIIGIIANPAAGKDIRRLVSCGIAATSEQKVNAVQRILVAAHAAGARDIRIMPDPYEIGQRALQNLRAAPAVAAAASLLEMAWDGTAADSYKAACLLKQAGAGCIVTLGGDGTLRVVAKGCGDVPLLPMKAGTNNVIPQTVEGTIAGLAAAYVAQRPQLLRTQVCLRYKRLELWVNGEPRDQALVDIALVRGRFTGARAVWEPESLRQVFVALAVPGSIGMSAIVAMIRPLEPCAEAGFVAVISGDAQPVVTPIAPGMIAPIGVADIREMAIDCAIQVLHERPAVLALDGEREHILSGQDQAEVVLRADGPWIVDVKRTLIRAVEEGVFCSPSQPPGGQ